MQIQRVWHFVPNSRSIDSVADTKVKNVIPPWCHAGLQIMVIVWLLQLGPTPLVECNCWYNAINRGHKSTWHLKEMLWNKQSVYRRMCAGAYDSVIIRLGECQGNKSKYYTGGFTKRSCFWTALAWKNWQTFAYALLSGKLNRTSSTIESLIASIRRLFQLNRHGTCFDTYLMVAADVWTRQNSLSIFDSITFRYVLARYSITLDKTVCYLTTTKISNCERMRESTVSWKHQRRSTDLRPL